MRKSLIVAGFAALTLVPSLAAAQQTCEERRANRAAGTVVGGVLGALAGRAIAGKGDNTEGTIIGGVGGAVVGNQIAKGSGDCTRAYGYYDDNGRWHSNTVNRSYAQGYYDRSGNWIDGPPPSGRWGSDGRWAMSADAYGAPASYGASSYAWRSNWRDAPQDIQARTDWLERRIVRSRNSGAISRREAQRAMNTLQDIRRNERIYLRDGRMSGREGNVLMARLDDLNAQIRYDRRD